MCLNSQEKFTKRGIRPSWNRLNIDQNHSANLNKPYLGIMCPKAKEQLIKIEICQIIIGSEIYQNQSVILKSYPDIRCPNVQEQLPTIIRSRIGHFSKSLLSPRK